MERKYETGRAYQLLIKGKKGDVITADEMREKLGFNCWDSGGDGYRWMNSAMNKAIKNGVFWFRDAPGKRYVCGSIDDINRTQTSLIKQSNRRAKKSLNVALCVDPSEMTTEQANQHNMNTLVAGLICTASSAPARKRLEGRKCVQPSTEDLMKLVTGEK